MFTNRDDAHRLLDIEIAKSTADLYDLDNDFLGKNIEVIGDIEFGMDYHCLRWSMYALFELMPPYIKFKDENTVYKLKIEHTGVYYYPLNRDTYEISFLKETDKYIIKSMVDCIIWLYKTENVEFLKTPFI